MILKWQVMCVEKTSDWKVVDDKTHNYLKTKINPVY